MQILLSGLLQMLKQINLGLHLNSPGGQTSRLGLPPEPSPVTHGGACPRQESRLPTPASRCIPEANHNGIAVPSGARWGQWTSRGLW